MLMSCKNSDCWLEMKTLRKARRVLLDVVGSQESKIRELEREIYILRSGNSKSDRDYQDSGLALLNYEKAVSRCR